MVVSNAPAPRRTGDVDVLPWRAFLERLRTEEIL